MKIQDKRSLQKYPEFQTAKDIPVGTTFEGSAYYGTSIFYRGYGVVVDLKQPTKTWLFAEGESGPSFTNYVELDATLIIRLKE